jgi:membrane protein DedA with SNARE-associated domain
MDIAVLIQTVGYPAVALGTFLEGETMLLAAGFAANRGYLELGIVMLVATLASFTSDQTFFWLGRCAGPRLTARWPRLGAGVASLRPMIERHPVKLILGVRFMIGLRTVGPIALGMTPALSAHRFIGLNLLAAALWAGIGSSLGYFFGRAIGWALVDVSQYQALALMTLVATVTLVWCVRSRRRRA